MSDQDRQPDKEESVALREELARVQEAARKALSNLRDEVDYLREAQDPDHRDPDSVTTQVALQQEIDTLRRMLRERERLVEDTATQCRHLEDELEDQYRTCDTLKQDLERNKLSLDASREQMARVSRERHEIEEHYQDLLASSLPGILPGGHANRPASRKSSTVSRFIGGLVAGLLLAAVALVVWMQLDPRSAPVALWRGEKEVASPADASPKTSHGDAQSAPDEHSQVVTAGERSEPVPVKRVRDRLSDGSFGPWMLALEGGDFSMGKKLAPPGDEEGPAHVVHLARFLVSATEVTFKQYDRFARATGRRLPSDFGWGRGSHPVVDVTWEDARAYVQWLSRSTGRDDRRPSESEWEYAAGAGQRTFFWWGNEPGQGRAVCYDCGTRWDKRSTAPVGSFDPNPFGLYDTAGNAMEWVEDCYHSDYVDAPVDGRAWVERECGLRVARGGAFNKPSRSMHSTARHSYAPETHINAIGFRVARDE